jgi:chromosome segregation ATPase
MSQEPVTITYSLESVLEQINQKLDRLDQKFDKLQEEMTDLKVGQARLEEKMDGLAKRIDNQEFLNRGVLVGLILAFLAGLAKLFGVIGNP